MKNKYIRFFVAFITVMLLVAALGVMINAAVTSEGIMPFEDVRPSYWFANAVEFCYVNDVINGMNEYTFAHSDKLTRAQFVTMLANIENIEGGYVADRFTDVKPSHWYYNAVSWALDADITSGTGEHTFSPNAYITREQLAVMLSRYMDGKRYEVSVSYDCLDRFIDRHEISSYAVKGMKYTVSVGLIDGMTEDTLSPRTTVTRAQAARIFMLYLKNYRYSGHTHMYNAPSCTESAVCSLCGMVMGLPLGHDVSDSFSCKFDYNSECRRCGQWVSASSMPHDYAPATCGRPETCIRCSATRGKAVGAHTWWAATCTNPKMCRVCYKTEGKALGHSWKAADCIAPKTCTRCKATEGSALSANKQHTWWAATCKNPKMCRICYKTEGSALGHTTYNGMCTRCKTLNFTSDFKKVEYHLKNSGTYHSMYGVYYVSDFYEFEDADTFNVIVEYDPASNRIHLKANYTFFEGDSDELNIEIGEGMSSYLFTYTYMREGITVFDGEGHIDPKSYTKGTGESFDRYTGTLTAVINEYLDDSLDTLLDLTEGCLDYLYTGTLGDLGFIAYVV